ncbi:MAG: DEAD/DEAH box helicase [Candidatus Gastranaerophilaceae bacterium]|jgi:superfamily II RNA helicase
MKLGFDFKLDDFQLEAVKCIDEGKSVVVCAPTGAGKTVIAEHAIHNAIKEDKRLFYTTPLKALSNQKFNDFTVKYGEERVGLLTGDISINRNAQIVIMTTEVFRNMLYGTNLGKIEENLKNVKYVVLDEVHYMNDEQRGTVWEESIIYCQNNVQLIALSATVANAKDLTEWINTVHSNTKLINTDFRPVPLRHYFYSENNPHDIFPLFEPGGLLNRKLKAIAPKGSFTGKKSKKLSPADLVSVLHEKDMLPAIYFTFSRKKCDLYMQDCTKLKLLNNFEEKRIVQIIDEYVLDNPYLARNKNLEYLYSGVASHHAGLLPGWKGLIEKLFQQGLIKVVFATETLAAGINMPARSTVISSISKRTDNGHRNLTPNEFLQMSGRAGRRGMDKIGHVIVLGSQFHDPSEIATLASSQADPLGSKFTPSYSMVLNLLQRFSLEQARELILKSFGYFNSTERLKPYYDDLEYTNVKIAEIDNFPCPFKYKLHDLLEFNKYKNLFVQYRKITNNLKTQAKKAGRKDAEEVIEYSKQTKSFYLKMEQKKCNNCKMYKRHIKEIEIKERFEKKQEKLIKTIEHEKDIYWNSFLNLTKVLDEFGYLVDNFPTDKGLTTAAVRAENELFFSELIFNGLLNHMTHVELASILCAVTTEDDRTPMYFHFKISPMVRKTLSEARDIIRKIAHVQKQHDVNVHINLNPQYSSLIEHWIEGGEWSDLTVGIDVSEGDLVRVFKRTIDLLRQLTTIPNVPVEIAKNAQIAIDCINRDPVSDEI